MIATAWPQRPSTRRSRLRFLWPLVALLITYILFSGLGARQNVQSLVSDLVQKQIGEKRGIGGRWYIPPSWLQDARALDNVTIISQLHPETAVEAAQLALELALLTSAFAAHTHIPLIAHQTWRSLETSTWSEGVQHSVDSWLTAAINNGSYNGDMAYIMWDDDGMDQLIQSYEPQLWSLFPQLPYPVEKADTFRVTVLRWFGGFYGDVDVSLLEHPAEWVHAADLKPWTDSSTGATYGPLDSLSQGSINANTRSPTLYQVPLDCPSTYSDLMSQELPSAPTANGVVGAIFGIECDANPRNNDHWRWGYTYPVQLTNWAMAAAPLHPATGNYLSLLTRDIQGNASRISSIDPLDLTGPPALTRAVMSYSTKAEGPDFNWNSLSGLSDPPGGRGKVVGGDILVLPITGFSPGRGWLHNMGSMPVTHDNARLLHLAQGSWRKLNTRVQMGKLCRTVLGRCKDWRKIP